jgi:hypothetical protein
MLAKLADRGLVAPPSLAMDLVHDFMLEGHADDVERTHLPEKGSLGFRRCTAMEREKVRVAEDVLLDVLRRPGDAAALQELRERAVEVRHTLEDTSLELSAHDQALHAHPEFHAAQVFAEREDLPGVESHES